MITEFKSTVFTAPIIGDAFRFLSLAITKVIGWKLVGEVPKKRKCILIAAPHTSNWDFALLLLIAFIWRVDLHWMGKDSLFPFPIRRLAIWFGGIPIDRSQSNNMVDQMVQHYKNSDELIVIVPPEGTRSKVERWKTGFYHIAHQANVPILLGFIDAATKTMGFGGVFEPTGDIDKDIVEIQKFYKDKVGFMPENQYP